MLMHARSPAKNMKTPAKWPAISRKPNNTPYRCGFERRSRCSLPTSNASSAWAASDCEVHAAQMMNSSSQQPPKTSANWPRSFLHRRKYPTPDRKGALAQFRAQLSAPAKGRFSTESAETGHSLHVRDRKGSTKRADAQGITRLFALCRRGELLV